MSLATDGNRQGRGDTEASLVLLFAGGEPRTARAGTGVACGVSFFAPGRSALAVSTHVVPTIYRGDEHESRMAITRGWEQPYGGYMRNRASGGLAASIVLALMQTTLPEPTAAADGSSEAADSDTGQAKLDEVIVTANKRTENLHDVPASIVAVSAEQLSDADVNSALDLSRVVPGFAIDSQKSLFTTIFVRGIGTISNGYSVEPSVGTVVDGVVQARAGSSVYSNYDDIERVEVLRGPQGTLFGKNSSAGVVSVVTKDPTEELTGKLGVSYGSYHEVKVHGAVSGPIVNDELLGRFAFATDSHDGYIHNIFDDRDVDSSHQQSFRAKLLFKPQDGTRILLNADYWDLHSDCCAAVVRAVTPFSNVAELGSRPEFPGYPAGFLGQTNDQIDAQGQARTDNRSQGVSLQWDQEIGSYTLTSISAYRAWNAFSDDALLVNTTPVVSARFFDTTVHQHQASEELRIASPIGGMVDYVGGVFFIVDSISDHQQWSLDQAAVNANVLPGEVVLPVDYENFTSTKNYAVFGEANFHVTSAITLVAGARETHEKVDFKLGGSLFGFIPVGADESDSVNELSWRLGARWAINPDNMTYATVSRGFKGPAFNGNSLVFGNGQRANPEIATSYEIGWKANFLDNRVRSNLALFLTNLNQFQVQGAFIQNSVGIQLLTNAGQLRSQGVELEVDTTPVKNLTIDFNSAYIDARYTDFPNAPCYLYQTAAQGCGSGLNGAGQNLSGVSAPDTPTFSYNVSANYDIALANVPFDAFVRTDYSWMGKLRWDSTNDPTTIQQPYGVLGGALGIQSHDKHFLLSLYGRNLTNKFHVSQLLGQPTPQSILPPDYKRTWGVQFRYRY
jgi:iron complex outermembrane receptor protein